MKTFKHQQGRHDQKRHGWRGGQSMELTKATSVGDIAQSVANEMRRARVISHKPDAANEEKFSVINYGGTRYNVSRDIPAADVVNFFAVVENSARYSPGIKKLISNAGDVFLSNQTNKDNPNADAVSGGGTIYVYKKGLRNANEVIIHESAHLYAQNSNKGNMTPLGWESAIKGERPPTAYATTNHAEDFAESVGLYFREATRLQQESPQRYQYIDSIFGATSTLKHHTGQHNQKRHGWRYNGRAQDLQAQRTRVGEQQGQGERGVLESRIQFMLNRVDAGEKAAQYRREMWQTIAKKKPAQAEREYKPGSDIGAVNALVAIKQRVSDEVSISSGLVNQQDVVLGAISNKQGFDGKPQVATKAEMDAAVADGATEIFRGVRDAGGRTAESMFQQFAEGDFFFGNGVHGNGTYTAVKHDTASGYGRVTARMALRKNAKIVDKEDIKAQMYQAKRKFDRDIEDRQDDIMNKIRALPAGDSAIDPLKQQFYALSKTQTRASRIFGDPGRFAAMAGYDAIKVDRGGDDYFVLINRTAVIIQNTLYFDGVETTGGFAHAG